MSRYIFNGTFKDGNGIIVESGTITVYLAGTSTLATIYTASSGGSADSDSAVASGTDGAFLFYVDENDYLHGQLFKITLSKTNFNSKSYDNIAIFPSETPNIVTKTTTYTAVLSDDIILCNGTFTLTLPAATTTTGKPFDIINIGTGTITISPNVDGASKTLAVQYQGTRIVSDGTNYYSAGVDGTIGGNYIYRAGGTDVALADGGTGASLTDPNADRIMFWDDSVGATAFLAPDGTNLAISGTTLDVGSGIYRSGGTDVALADGGTGASLTDPNADRIPFWDDSAGAIVWLTAGSGLTITDTTITSGGTSPSFSVHKSGTNQTGIVTATYTLVTWPTELWDTNSNFASNRFTPTVEGYYLLTAQLSWATESSAHFTSIYKNGSVFLTSRLTLTSNARMVPITAIVYANGSTDYFEIYGYQTTGANDTVYGDIVETWFMGNKLP